MTNTKFALVSTDGCSDCSEDHFSIKIFYIGEYKYLLAKKTKIQTLTDKYHTLVKKVRERNNSIRREWVNNVSIIRDLHGEPGILQPDSPKFAKAINHLLNYPYHISTEQPPTTNIANSRYCYYSSEKLSFIPYPYYRSIFRYAYNLQIVPLPSYTTGCNVSS